MIYQINKSILVIKKIFNKDGMVAENSEVQSNH